MLRFLSYYIKIQACFRVLEVCLTSFINGNNDSRVPQR